MKKKKEMQREVRYHTGYDGKQLVIYLPLKECIIAKNQRGKYKEIGTITVIKPSILFFLKIKKPATMFIVPKETQSMKEVFLSNGLIPPHGKIHLVASKSGRAELSSTKFEIKG